MRIAQIIDYKNFTTRTLIFIRDNKSEKKKIKEKKERRKKLIYTHSVTQLQIVCFVICSKSKAIKIEGMH